MRHGARVALLGALAALALAALAPAAALADEKVREKGEVRAVLSYDETEDFFNFENVMLEISHSGVVVYTHTFEPICKGCSLAPDGYGKGFPLRLRNLDQDPEPEVLTTFYTGGAHCCTYAVAFDRAGDTYTRARYNFLDAGFGVEDRDGDGIAELLTGDARFAYKYGCFACSVFPVRVIQLRGGKFVNATPKFRKLVRRDARLMRGEYRQLRGKTSVRPVLAAFVADKCSLGNCKGGFRVVRRALRAGYLGRQNKFETDRAFGKAYVRSLKRFLRNLGYR